MSKFSKGKRLVEGWGEESVFLTKTVMTVMSQHEAIETGAAIVAWNVQTVVDAASIESIVTFIHV